MNVHKPTRQVEAVKNATSAGRLATSPAPAPNQRVPEVLTTAATVAVVVAVAVEATTLSVVVVVETRRPGGVEF